MTATFSLTTLFFFLCLFSFSTNLLGVLILLEAGVVFISFLLVLNQTAVSSYFLFLSVSATTSSLMLSLLICTFRVWHSPTSNQLFSC